MAMTLDLGTDMGHVETRQRGLPTEALHDLTVLTFSHTVANLALLSILYIVF